ncbi:efflux RND transporter periplasmic adaptor subunit [Ruficoccus sp. ZRK36]|uniref:efflux RND transporter periplasmic adaptor subunit n=1 Tax=Ruficoccus sp. ZRK36 TaxID=2866311 RepID=UPI001C73CA78|nr:efflux RND transporter periplasmic adaptor subunit [Ruficoccus sp. ZRK36]QYY35071.1 efflux RND transporter periplasmic adaptor subunit [Ruficoccus sp. ZRK36]
MKIKPILAVLVLAGIGVGLWIWKPFATSDAENEHRIYGNVDIRISRLAFNESELITEMLVDEGDPVQAGQPLAKLRAERLEAQLSEARAQVATQQAVVNRLENGSRPQEIERARADMAAAQVRLDKAKNDFSRVEKTAKTGASSQREFDRIKALLDEAEADLIAREQTLDLAVEGPRQEVIDEARARLGALEDAVALLEIRVRDTVLYAPEDGVIETRYGEPGQMATPATPVLSLALNARKWVRAYLPEPLLGQVQPGQKVKVFSDSWPRQSFAGTVGFISPVAEFTPKTVETEELRTKLVYEVRVWVEDDENRLRLGMPVTVDLASAGEGTRR